ncbi:MAG TPA: alpha/beta hydrolase [Alphaproteobacteria bacterium]|nr:alpha/beta hydrolase [Alphaproteobacteria bacterium]
MEHLAARAAQVTNVGSPRDLRIKLQRGGYYFVDMSRYMPFYFGEVDTATMPLDAIVEESERTVFDSFLAKPQIGRVVICVHGFNVHLHAADGWYRILTETMRKLPGAAGRLVTDPDDELLMPGKGTLDRSLSAFIGFSWPSNGSVFSYNRDQLDAAASAQPLAALIARVHQHGKKVDLICHSMGNYAACSMLQGLVNKTFVPPPFLAEELERQDRECNRPVQDREAYRSKSQTLLNLIQRGTLQNDETVTRADGWFIDNLVMIAADVERRHVTKAAGRTNESNYIGPFYSGLQHLVRRAHNFYSRFDGILNISSWEKKPKSTLLTIGDRLSALTFGMLDFLERNPDFNWEARLGVAPHPSSAPPNFISVNATERAGRAIDHGDHIDSREVVRAIAHALELVPEQPG